MSSVLDRIAHRAGQKNVRFTTLAHHLTPEFLESTWHGLNQRGAPGISGETMEAYGKARAERIPELVERLKRHAYRVPPVRRTYIPKAGNTQKMRPLGIPEVEDRLLQAAVSRLLTPIYEAVFQPCSYGFRPGRDAHQALAALDAQLAFRPINWVYEADVQGFFDHLDHEWLLKMLDLRMGDPGITRLIRKWLTAPIVEPDGKVHRPTEGSPQGGPLSPLLANIHLHYALDQWFVAGFRRTCTGEAYLTRYADDFVVAFEREEDARRFASILPERLAKFGITLAPEKTRHVRFGRREWAQAIRERRPTERFEFLGFVHVGGRTQKGRPILIRRPSTKSQRKFLQRVKGWLAGHQHDPTPRQQAQLSAMLRGHDHYFGLPGCLPKLRLMRVRVLWTWRATLNRRSQRSRHGWGWYASKPWFRLPTAKLRPKAAASTA